MTAHTQTHVKTLRQRGKCGAALVWRSAYICINVCVYLYYFSKHICFISVQTIAQTQCWVALSTFFLVFCCFPAFLPHHLNGCATKAKINTLVVLTIKIGMKI